MGVRAQGEGEGRGGKGVRRRGDHAAATAQRSDGSAAPIAFASAHRHVQHPSAMHATGSDAAPDATIHATTDDSAAVEVALLRVTTHAMEQLAAALTAKPTRLDTDERAKFGDEGAGRGDAAEVDGRGWGGGEGKTWEGRRDGRVKI